jgi:dTDP-4-dehydrorhamnose reductase
MTTPAKKIAILGSRGRLGAALQRLWTPFFEIHPFSRADLDISDFRQVETMLRKTPCHFVLNCTGLTDVDYCEEHPEEAFLLNATVPDLMAQICAERAIRFIHFSTDYVFDGEDSKDLTEEDPVHPINEYGRSKWAGENAVLRASPAHVLLRVSWVFGPDKNSFIDNLLMRAYIQDRVAAVADKTSCPTYTHDIAEWTNVFLRNEGSETPGGLYHLCNSGEGGGCSWRDYGQYALDCTLKRGLSLKSTTVWPLKLEEMGSFIAKRPRYSTLSTKKFAAIWGAPLRSWKEAVWDYLSGN